MNSSKLLLLGLFLACALPSMAAPKTQSIAQLEERLIAIDSALEQLADYSLQTGFGPVGYASLSTDSPATREWVQIELEQPTAIDQIVLVPSIGRDTETGFRANGFPLEFQILAGTGGDTNGVVVAEFGKEDHLLPRIAPLIVPCSITASWVRVEASLLSQRIYDEFYDLKFAEIMLFNGPENVALKSPIKTSTQIRNRYKTQHPRFLTDGFLPYQMDAVPGNRSLYVQSGPLQDDAWMAIDLETTQSLNRIHLHSVDPSYSAPLDHMPDFNIPRSMRLEGALKPDFSDAKTLIDLQYKSLLDVGTILMHRFPETPCRYVRFTHIDPYIDTRFSSNQSRLGFAEIELFAKGKNVALGKSFTANFNARNEQAFTTLTDGLNFYGKILPVREWMNELALRHDLEVERPLIVAELNTLYARQKTNLKWMRWLAIFAIAGIGITILVDRMIRMHIVIKLRERIAANLHDELSANLHALSLLGEVAKKNIDKKKKLDETLDRMQQLFLRSRNATRHCTNMLKADTACEDLVEEMEHSSNRLLGDKEHKLIFEGRELLHQLPARKRVDLFLFYKECLINILRHSSATSCCTRLTASPKLIHLEITDNGSGITEVPHSLKRRARLSGGRVHIETPKGGGTTVILSLRLHRELKPLRDRI
jgi:signal transduction histidine kinase